MIVYLCTGLIHDFFMIIFEMKFDRWIAFELDYNDFWDKNTTKFKNLPFAISNLLICTFLSPCFMKLDSEGKTK